MQKCHVSPKELHVRMHPTGPVSAFQSGRWGLAEPPGVKEPRAQPGTQRLYPEGGEGQWGAGLGHSPMRTCRIQPLCGLRQRGSPEAGACAPVTDPSGGSVLLVL